MAVLNEYPIMTTTNIFMIIAGIAFIIGGFAFLILSTKSRSCLGFVTTFSLGITVLIVGAACLYNCQNPSVQYPTGKKLIEAKFANGEMPACYEDDYNVIDIYNGGVYLLAPKDGASGKTGPSVQAVVKEEVG